MAGKGGSGMAGVAKSAPPWLPGARVLLPAQRLEKWLLVLGVGWVGVRGLRGCLDPEFEAK